MASGSSLRVETAIDASRTEVWAYVRDIATHVDWMHDAVAIRFLDDQRAGVGTRFECDTKIGPFSLTDVMEVTAWEDEHRIGVRHVGLITGEGDFSLEELTPTRTAFRWVEVLEFPWYLGGRFAAAVASPILRRVWNRNLEQLKARIET